MPTALIDVDKHLFEPIVKPGYADLDQKRIQSSPYTEIDHLLNLDDLQFGYRAIALALQSFEITSQRYAFDPYDDSFNIQQIWQLAHEYAIKLGKSLPTTEIYVIAFRSQLHTETQQSEERRVYLGQVDKASHQEANLSGGLLKYWFGTPEDTLGRNLATCWWRSKEDAKAGGGGKAHRQGMAKVKGWFGHWQVEEYRVVFGADRYSIERIN